MKVNCAAIPTELIESELFGHEKGAFTGAAALRRGKFELADGGTIFLDEVGDLHEASQAKLLRVLQDGELQRVGGEQTIRVSTRIISATNRRLDELVSAGRFREDLYYRLSVVPIRVPALRERLDDIAELVPYFLSEFCARNNFRPRTIDDETVALLERYAWPGNVRELRNVVERMAILAPGDRITADAIPLEVRSEQAPARRHGTAGSARLSRARADPAGAGPDRLERHRGGAAARYRTDGAPQADPHARPEAGLVSLDVRRRTAAEAGSADRACGRIAGDESDLRGRREGRERAAMDWWRSPDGDAVIRRLAASRVTVEPTLVRDQSTIKPQRRPKPDRVGRN